MEMLEELNVRPYNFDAREENMQDKIIVNEQDIIHVKGYH